MFLSAPPHCIHIPSGSCSGCLCVEDPIPSLARASLSTTSHKRTQPSGPRARQARHLKVFLPKLEYSFLIQGPLAFAQASLGPRSFAPVPYMSPDRTLFCAVPVVLVQTASVLDLVTTPASCLVCLLPVWPLPPCVPHGSRNTLRKHNKAVVSLLDPSSVPPVAWGWNPNFLTAGLTAGHSWPLVTQPPRGPSRPLCLSPHTLFF